MAVYVDKPFTLFRGMHICHMMADTIEELHEMARKLGLKRVWYQHLSTPHYDLAKSKRTLAIKYGAVEADRKKIVELIKEWRNHETTSVIKTTV